MVEVASRELRNDTAGVLRKVEAGETIVITRRGKPVADLVPHRADEPRWLTREEVLDTVENHSADVGMREFLDEIGESTDDLGPIL